MLILGEVRNNFLDALNDAEKIYKAMQYSHKLEAMVFVLEDLTKHRLTSVYSGVVNRDNGVSAEFDIMVTYKNENGIDEYQLFCYGIAADLTKFLSKK